MEKKREHKQVAEAVLNMYNSIANNNISRFLNRESRDGEQCFVEDMWFAARDTLAGSSLNGHDKGVQLLMEYEMRLNDLLVVMEKMDEFVEATINEKKDN